ncbi:MAG: type II toxin-antitoxin system VapB family antitoxin [Myxococcales bacterium]|nr:type II toxin-antitoxin system VapB family antitoxin [Myxococcales bacterium]
MALNIENEVVEALASEVAEITGESKTEAVRRALVERLQRLEGRRRLGPDAQGRTERSWRRWHARPARSSATPRRWLFDRRRQRQMPTGQQRRSKASAPPAGRPGIRLQR